MGRSGVRGDVFVCHYHLLSIRHRKAKAAFKGLKAAAAGRWALGASGRAALGVALRRPPARRTAQRSLACTGRASPVSLPLVATLMGGKEMLSARSKSLARLGTARRAARRCLVETAVVIMSREGMDRA